MLRDEDKQTIRKRLEEMNEPVKLLYFTQKIVGSCQYCLETEQLLQEVTELSDKLSMVVYNYVSDKDEVEKYKIDKIPATVIANENDHGIRFYGIPSGYEFATFLETILLISKKTSELSEDTVKQIALISEPVHIQVFVTPTCPYCQKASLTAYKFAIHNENITADAVEVSEFMHLGQKYNVMGVPKVIINEDHAFEGALPENLFIEEIKKGITVKKI